MTDNKNPDGAPLNDKSGELSDSLTKTLEMPIPEFARGSIFAGRYEVIEELGRGGMGKVYRVEDTKIKEEVALKILRPEFILDKRNVERFSNELKMARRISHKNVCRMYHFGEEQGLYFITMEYVEGEDLKSTMRRVGPLSGGKAIAIAKQVCKGLAEAHVLGVIHRDLKPQNIMIDKEGNVRIMDFGIAKFLKTEGITATGTMIGTPEYMSPEQVQGKDVGPRSDLYSLGIILYEMVTGRVPFEGDTTLSIALKHSTETAKNPRQFNDQIPIDLSSAIMKCLEKNMDGRFQNAGDLLVELGRIEKEVPSTERVLPKRKPLTSREITFRFSLKKLTMPAVFVLGLALGATVVWRFVPHPQPPQAAAIEPDAAVPAPENELSVGQENRELRNRAEASTQIVTAQKKAEVRVGKVPAVSERKTQEPGIKDRAEAIRLKAILPTPPEAQVAEKVDVSALLASGIAAYDQGEYDLCIKQLSQVIKVDPAHDQALQYLEQAKQKIISGRINSLVQEYIDALNGGRLLSFYEAACVPDFFGKIRKETELLVKSYDQFQALASDIKVHSEGPTRLKVEFVHIMTGVSGRERLKQVLFEGVYIWEMENSDDIWKITKISSRRGQVKK